MGSPKSYRITSTELIVPSIVDIGCPIIKTGVNIYINTVVKITILGFHPMGKNGASILANQVRALPRGHTSFWTPPRRMHTTHVNSTSTPRHSHVSDKCGHNTYSLHILD